MLQANIKEWHSKALIGGALMGAAIVMTLLMVANVLIWMYMKLSDALFEAYLKHYKDE